MQITRRLYLYAVSLVSLETVLWGLIGLARLFLSPDLDNQGETSRLAEVLSLVLVGLPVFGLHWWLVQRSAWQDPAERTTWLRAVFLYAALLLTLVPAAQNAIALLSRLGLFVFGADASLAVVGAGQGWGDNLVALAVNALAGAYFFSVLRADWRALPQGEDYWETRRIFRYLVLVLGLVWMAYGAQLVLEFLLTFWHPAGWPPAASPPAALFANGLALLLVGTPVWVAADRTFRRTSDEGAEAGSVLRLVLLYALVFAGLVGMLFAARTVLYAALQAVLGPATGLAAVMTQVAWPLSVFVPAAGVWLYYWRILNEEMGASQERSAETRPAAVAYAQPDPTRPSQTTLKSQAELRRARLRRLYFYGLALLGLAGLFAGLYWLLGLVVDVTAGSVTLGRSSLAERLAQAMAAAVIAAPLWSISWRPMRLDAQREGEAGDRSRRSLVRKAYLYGVLFVAILGLMFTAGQLLFELLQAVLGAAQPDLLHVVLLQLRLLFLFALLFGYHVWVLRGDARLAERSLARRHAQYPVLVLAPGEPDASRFADELVTALQHTAPALPVAVHPYSLGVPDETLSAARAVILPAELVARPSEALRLWLQAFSGPRLVISTPIPSGWHWISGEPRRLKSLARQAAHAIRQLAEGQDVAPPRESSLLMGLVYGMAGLFALQLVLLLLAGGVLLAR